MAPDKHTASDFREPAVPVVTSAEPLALAPRDPLALIALALERGANPADMTALYDLYERDQKRKAEVAYNQAMQAAQAEMPVIVCDAYNSQTRSKYPSVENMNRQCKPIYTRHGFALSFGQGVATIDTEVRTTCLVMHRDGHAKEYWIDLPNDGVGIKGQANMTPLHGRLSSKTYAQSKQLREIFNLTVSDDADDRDGNGPVERITQEELNTIKRLLIQTAADEPAFLRWASERSKCEIGEVMDIPRALYPTALQLLNDKARKQAAQKGAV